MHPQLVKGQLQRNKTNNLLSKHQESKLFSRGGPSTGLLRKNTMVPTLTNTFKMLNLIAVLDYIAKLKNEYVYRCSDHWRNESTPKTQCITPHRERTNVGLHMLTITGEKIKIDGKGSVGNIEEDLEVLYETNNLLKSALIPDLYLSHVFS